MLKTNLKAGVALCALMLPLGSALAQTAQTVTNDATVAIVPSAVEVIGNLGTGASASINSTGAAASVSNSAVNAPFATSATVGTAPILTTLGAISQGTTNTGTITITEGRALLTGAAQALNFGAGAAVGISATGAASALSIQGISTGPAGSLPTIASLSQAANNSGLIKSDSGQIIIPGSSTTSTSSQIDPGVSLSISASGAVSSLSLGLIGASVAPAQNIGGVTQNSQNTGAVNQGGGQIARNGDTVVGGTQGAGFSMSLSATGAVASVGMLAIGDGARFEDTSFGATSQTANNTAAIGNTMLFTGGTGGTALPYNLSGAGASMSVSSTGAAAATSVTALAATNPFGTLTVASLGQNVTNSGAVSNGFVTTDTTRTAFQPSMSVSGTGASLSFAATGASASLGATSIQGTGVSAPTVSGTVSQTVTNASTGLVTNDTAGLTLGGNVSGTGASVSASATGAVASIGTTSIGSIGGSGLSFGSTVGQTVTNSAAVKNNTVVQGVSTFENISGAGASVSQSATGAVASISTSSLGALVNAQGAGAFGGMSFAGSVTQQASNSAAVTNNGSLNIGGLTADLFNLSGTGASLSHSTSGAVASIGSTSIAAAAGSTFGATTFAAPVTQAVTNTGAVSNTATATSGTTTTESSASRLLIGNLSGVGSSASLSVTGAAASISSNAIGTNAGTTPVSNGTFSGLSFAGDVKQTAGNTGTITNGVTANTSVVNATTGASLSGAGTSVSVSTTGAVASLGTSLIGFNGTLTPILMQSSTTTPVLVTQEAFNGGNISTVGDMGGGVRPILSGVGSSFSLSTTGAVASISNSSIGSSVTNAAITGTVAPTISQTAINGGGIDGKGTSTATVSTKGAIALGNLSGTGSSASISSTGAAASISVASIADTAVGSFTPLGAITQVATNKSGGTVTTAGNISVGSLGIGSSASVSAVGATASLSYRSVR